MILVSSCLAGLKVRYDGTDCLDHKISQLIKAKKAMPVCPELLGGFSTPREPAEIVGGDGGDVLDGKAKVIGKSGEDVTDQYLKGARITLKKVMEANAKVVVLKENSPSCGSTMIYNGEFSGTKIAGNGVTAALLLRNGVQVLSEEQFLNHVDDII
ncbi:2-thiouracil desulfurase family protein [Gracilibacillus alcaliphilus]|uniref:DUF523 domain-containing protein n=1 Tax=Gracilibacillus alcaliphilus TaxID=1401441 RepID=UPI001959C2FA|nr:DUF523 domain-containing protein [Gracilibacillus alcaliphilus]MBM7675799.1 uncharacterized protein YbbK (DUF523 family) [Gracilibacillus alcaliphilus]